jgi:hypothetical protein
VQRQKLQEMKEFMVVCKTVALRKGRRGVATEEGGWFFSS